MTKITSLRESIKTTYQIQQEIKDHIGTGFVDLADYLDNSKITGIPGKLKDERNNNIRMVWLLHGRSSI